MVPDASQACRLLGGMAIGPKSFLASWVKEHMWKSREETPNAHGLSVPQVSQPIHMSASLHYTEESILSRSPLGILGCRKLSIHVLPKIQYTVLGSCDRCFPASPQSSQAGKCSLILSSQMKKWGYKSDRSQSTWYSWKWERQVSWNRIMVLLPIRERPAISAFIMHPK